MQQTLFHTILAVAILTVSLAQANRADEFTTRGGMAFAPVIDLPAVLCVRDISHETLDRDMQTFKRQGWNRVYVIVANDSNPFYSNPWISMMSYAEGQPNNKMRHNFDQLGDPNAATVAAAKRAGLEVWAVYKPYEGGGYEIPHGTHADGSLAHIPSLGGLLTYNDSLLSEHPELRLKRRPEVDRSKGSVISRLELTYMLDTFTNEVGPERRSTTYGWLEAEALHRSAFDIYISDDNGDYALLGNFPAEYHEERRNIYDPNGFLLMENSRTLVAVIEGFEIPLDTHYLAIVPENAANKRLIPQTMIKVFAENGEVVPHTVSRYYRGTPFSEWQADRPDDYQWGREGAPQNVWTPNAIENFQQWGFVFEWHGIGFWGDGWVIDPPITGVARGKLEYLKGTHCEAYPEVRAHWLQNVHDFIEMGFDGIDFRLQYHSGMISDYVNYGFNQPIVDRYYERYGVDITELNKIDEDTALKMMKVRGSFFMEFLEDAVAALHEASRKAGIHLRHSNEDPTLAFGFNEMGFWAMPRIILDWQRAVELADELTLKDYYHNSFRPEMSTQIRTYAHDQGKFVWAHAYYQQGREANVEFLSALEADPYIDGALGYELYFGAGQVITDTFSHVLTEMDFTSAEGNQPDFISSPLPLIAYEGFWTIEPFTIRGRAQHYFEGQTLGNRRDVIDGTVGFPFHPDNNFFHWIGTTGTMRTYMNAALEHNGVQRLNNGALVITDSGIGNHNRRYARQITARIPASDRYYMSALVEIPSAGGHNAVHTSFRSVGFGHNRGVDSDSPPTNTYLNLDRGMHLGVKQTGSATYLCAFTAGSAFRMFRIDEDLAGKTLQVVLELAVNPNGSDLLTGWYAPEGLDHLLEIPQLSAVNVGNVWQSVDDISHLLITAQQATNGKITFDEVHLGTTLDSVTTLKPRRRQTTFILSGN